ncbi:MAG: hypothetical protein KF830_03510 [Planctomycetes bacterium]|nr:hypothetical protein [Planctomycetota bacterium]
MTQPHDHRTLQRFLDGELDAAAAAAFQTRLAHDPALRQRLAEEQQWRRGFAGARAAATVPPADFATGVLAAVRRLPDRALLRQLDAQAEQGARSVRLCQRLLLAAAVLFGLGLLWHGGLLDRHSDRLEAAPDEIQAELERLDARIRAGGLDPAVPPARERHRR